VRVSPQRKGEGVKRHAWRPMCTARHRREARRGEGGPTGTLAGAGACGSTSSGGPGRGEPNDGVGLGCVAVRRAEGAQTSMRRVATRARPERDIVV
jgi:hypothetical protein